MKVKSLCSFNRSSGRDGAVKTAIKLKTAPDIVPHHAAKSTIVRGALTSGDDDLLIILDTPNGDNVAKFALALGALGNVRTRTARAWPQSEFEKLISELP